MNLIDWLPLFPWEGPPLPRFLGIVWPWLGQQSLNTSLTPPMKYITSAQEEVETIVPQTPLATTYENIEEIEFPNGFDPETFMPKKIVVHRKAKEVR